MIITIDGPVASGKSTIGKLLAQKINAYYLYTGLLYRALAYLLMQKYKYTLATIGNPDLAKAELLLEPQRFIYRYTKQLGEHIVFDGTDITPFLKDAIIDQAASILSANNQVRTYLNKVQRTIADERTIVIDGRDAGSVVFAHAPYKFFLTADEKERAHRWQAQQASRGTIVSLDQALASIRSRDQRDSQRLHAPLIIPHGAHIIDTTGVSTQDIVTTMITYLNA